jgi:hypothetical protein
MLLLHPVSVLVALDTWGESSEGLLLCNSIPSALSSKQPSPLRSNPLLWRGVLSDKGEGSSNPLLSAKRLPPFLQPLLVALQRRERRGRQVATPSPALAIKERVATPQHP